MNNDILLNRKILQWGWYKDSATKDVFLHLLLTANWRDGEFLGHKILRGQCVFGRKKLAQELCFSEQSVRTAISHLRLTGEITIESTNAFSVATIVKYSDYQSFCSEANQQINQQSTSQLTNDQPTANQRLTTSKEGKEEKEGKSVNKYITTLSRSEKWNDAFRAFVEMRKAIKHNLTTHAAELIIGKLDKLTSDETEQIEILNQSIEHSWQGVFELKDKPNPVEGGVKEKDGIKYDSAGHIIL